MRRVAARILMWQAGVTLALGAVCTAAFGVDVGKSSLVGGLIGVIANLFMSIAALRNARTPALALGRLFVGQLLKVLLTVAMFIAVAAQKWLNWPALLGAYVLTLVVFWAVPVLSGQRLPPRSKGPA